MAASRFVLPLQNTVPFFRAEMTYVAMGKNGKNLLSGYRCYLLFGTPIVFFAAPQFQKTLSPLQLGLYRLHVEQILGSTWFYLHSEMEDATIGCL